MPIKWPWSRSRPAGDEQPSVQAGTSAPVDAGWRAVPPVQRTIGTMKLTAPPRSFTSSLATAQDPALISENRPSLLTTGSPVAVLRMAEQPDSVAAQPTSSPAPHSSRQWMPPLNAQRAALGAAVTAPPPTLPLMSSDAIEPYVDGAMSSGSLVDATDPDQPRAVPIVDHVESSGPSPVVAGGSHLTAAQRTVESAAPTSPLHPRPDAASVQPIVESSGHVPTDVSALQGSAVEDTVVPISAAPAVAANPDDTVRAALPSSLPATIPSAIPVAVVPSAPTAVNPLQRKIIDDVTEVGSTARPIDSPPTPTLMQRAAAGGDTASAVDVRRSVVAEPLAPRVAGSARVRPERMSDGPAVSAVQRSVTGGHAEAAAGIRPAAGIVTGEVPRPAFTASEAGVEVPTPSAAFSVPVEVQRSTAAIDAGDSTHYTSTTAPLSEPTSTVPVDSELPWAPEVVEHPARRLSANAQLTAHTDNPTSGAATASPFGQPFSTAVRTAQRSAAPESRSANLAQPIAALPVLQRAKDAKPGNAPEPVSTAMTTSSAVAPTAQPTVDGPPLPGRIVLLPPVRTETHASSANSAQPMSLQRMFGDFGQPATGSDVGPPHGREEHPAVPSMTFDAPTAQRELESDPDPIPVAQGISEHSLGEQAPPVQAASAPAPAPAAAQAPTDVDELVGRLYEPLAARLRAELWLDRERAGALMNLHR